MAEVFKRVKGMSLERLIALTKDAQDGLKEHVDQRAALATLILRSHRYDNHSYIHLERAGFDWVIVLNDTRGQLAAMTIEFGRKGGNLDKNGRVVMPMQPVAPLRKSVGL